MYFEPDHDRGIGERESSRLVDLILDLEQAAPTDARALRRAAGVRAETHWSRILSYDLDAGEAGWTNPPPSLVDEMNACRTGVRRTKRRFVTGAVITFSACALAYLAVAGGLHALGTPDGIGVPAADDVGVHAPHDLGVPARHGIDAPAPEGIRTPARERFAPHLLAREDFHVRIDPIQ